MATGNFGKAQHILKDLDALHASKGAQGEKEKKKTLHSLNVPWPCQAESEH